MEESDPGKSGIRELVAGLAAGLGIDPMKLLFKWDRTRLVLPEHRLELKEHVLNLRIYLGKKIAGPLLLGKPRPRERRERGSVCFSLHGLCNRCPQETQEAGERQFQTINAGARAASVTAVYAAEEEDHHGKENLQDGRSDCAERDL